MTLIQLKELVDAAIAAGAQKDSEVILECGCGTSEEAGTAYAKYEPSRGPIFQIFGATS